MQKISSLSEKATFSHGKNFSQELKGGDVVGLIGGLGAGKTTFVQGLADGLKIKGRVNSPTFSILKLYKTPLSKKGIKYLCHIDAYRLNGFRDLICIGVEDFLGAPDCITVIEWADRIKPILPKKSIVLNFKTTGTKRIITQTSRYGEKGRKPTKKPL